MDFHSTLIISTRLMVSHSGASIAPKRKGGSKIEEEREEVIEKVQERGQETEICD